MPPCGATVSEFPGCEVADDEAREGRALHGRVTIRARQVDHARQVGVCGTVATRSEKLVVAQVGDRVCGEVDKRVLRVLRR